MPYKPSLTNSIGFTSDALPALRRLNTLLSDTPRLPSGESKQAWGSLTTSIGEIEQNIIDGLNQSISKVYDQSVQTITQDIKQQTDIVQTQGVDAINGVFDPIIEAIQNLINNVQSIIDDIQGWFEDIIASIRDTIDSIGDWINGVIDDVSDWIVNAISNIANTISNKVNAAINAARDWIENAIDNISGYISDVIANARDWINGVYEGVSSWIENVVNKIKDTYEGLKETIEDKIQAFLEWFENAKKAVSDWFMNIRQEVAAWIDGTLLPNLNKAIEGAKTVVQIASTVWDAISSGDYNRAFTIIDDLAKGLGIPAPVQTIRSLVSVLAYFWETVHLQFVALELSAQKNAEIALALNPLDLGTATTAFYKGLMSTDEYNENARLTGIAKARTDKVIEANRPLPSAGQVQDSFLRGEISLEQHDNLLRSYGLSDENINLIKQLYMIIPGVQDLIRMAVREAFTPDIAQKFGQYEDLPTEFVNWGVKQGLSKEWCSRYWAAHWDLPSPQMGFEMLHRGVISNDELTLLLRALDVMPFWREKLIQISYNPLTRVDVRRMYSLGILDEEQVKRAYLDIGYNDEKAEWLKEFTIRYYTPEDMSALDEFKTQAKTVYTTAYKKRIISEQEYRGLLETLKYHSDDIDLLVSLANYSLIEDDKLFDLQGYRKDWQKLVLSAYDTGLLHPNEVRGYLTDMGYSDDEVNLEINLADYNRTLRIKNLVAKQVHDMYVDYIIDTVQMHTLLDAFNFVSDEEDRYQEEWDIERNLRTRRPSFTDLNKFFKQGIISLEQLLEELRGEGYNEKYIEYYRTSLAPKGA